MRVALLIFSLVLFVFSTEGFRFRNGFRGYRRGMYGRRSLFGVRGLRGIGLGRFGRGTGTSEVKNKLLMPPAKAFEDDDIEIGVFSNICDFFFLKFQFSSTK